MRCEVCGHKIHGKPHNVVIEGAKLTVCSKCAKHGTTTWEEAKPKTITPKPKASTAHLALKTRKKQPQLAAESTMELVENFDVKLRQAREKLGISHEELGRKISEKVSVLKKIETGKMTPDHKLVLKLEHALKVKLLVPTSEEKIPQIKIPKPARHDLTLGDLVKLNKKKMEEKK